MADLCHGVYYPELVLECLDLFLNHRAKLLVVDLAGLWCPRIGYVL